MRRVLWAVLASAVAVTGFFTWRADQIVPGPGALDRPECGHSWPDSVKIPLIQNIADIPEFHDCQRFIVTVDRERRYGPLAAIFASAELLNLEKQLPPLSSGTGRGGDAARGTANSAASPQIAPNIPLTSRAVPVGVIYADAAYDPLGIKPLLNCLYIYWTTTGGADTTWSARMVPEGEADECQSRSAESVQSYTVLEVKRAVVDDPVTGQKFAAAEDYPLVARWDWDPKNEEQYVGIYCGTAWCEIGRPGFSTSDPLRYSSSDSREQRRVRLVKGWYDRQHLAEFDANGKLVPTTIVGTIVPHPDLGSVTEMPDYVHVGDVWLESSSDADKKALKEYEKKFGFKKTSPDDPSKVTIKNPGGSDQPEQFWESKIKAPGWLWFNDKKKRVKYRKLAATYDVPGVVRWRWMTLDEGTWARCPFGCCEISYY